jgi:hypothetical protein
MELVLKLEDLFYEFLEDPCNCAISLTILSKLLIPSSISSAAAMSS